jgi:diguanylate cyclase (GGDEF)-like protein/PAS domain S-box-containing protein
MSTRPDPGTPSEQAVYADLFNRLMDPAFILDPTTFSVLETNPACTHLLGAGARKLAGVPITQLVDEADRRQFLQQLRIARRRYYPRYFEARLQLDLGNGLKTISIEALASPLRMADGTELVQVVCRDISARKEAETRIKSLVTDLEHANEKLRALSTIDEVSKLFNQRYFLARLEQEHIRAARYNTHYSILYCSVDCFRAYTERNGKDASETLLEKFGDMLKGRSRTSDVPARLVRCEFAILCPLTDSAGALAMAKRLCRAAVGIDYCDTLHRADSRCTLSIGVSGYPEHGTTAEHILEQARLAMESARDAGGNRAASCADLSSIPTPKAA